MLCVIKNNNELYQVSSKFSPGALIADTVQLMIKSYQNNTVRNRLVFEERGKLEFLEKNLLEQSRDPTNSGHM